MSTLLRFVGFNRAIGSNSDNVEADDLVTLYKVTNGDGVGYSTSSLKATLGSGESCTVSDWKNSGMSLVITVNQIDITSSPGYALVDIKYGAEVPPTSDSGSSFMDWLASLPPGGAFAVIFAITAIPCILLCVCCCYSRKKRRSYYVDESSGDELYGKGT